MSWMAGNTKFYVVLVQGKWEVWDKTMAQMTALTNQDRKLADRLAHAPFDTRAEAENWITAQRENRRKRGL